MLACVGGVGCGDACGGCVPGRGLFARRWAAVVSRGAEGRALLREGVVAATGCLPRPEGLLCSGGGVNEWRVRECVGRRRALAVASGAVFKPGRGEVAVREVLRGAVGVARGEGEAWAVCRIICAINPRSLVRSFVPGVACRCVGGGAVAGLGISSAFGFASRLLKLLSVAGFSPCGGHRMCVERRSVQVFVSAFQLIVSSCASPCPVGLSRCTAVVLAASLPVGDRGARSGRFFGAWSVDSDKLWCKGIG